MCYVLLLYIQCPIVERLTNSLMMHGRNNGKKLMAVRIVKHSFEIIHLLTGEVRGFTLNSVHVLIHGDDVQQVYVYTPMYNCTC